MYRGNAVTLAFPPFSGAVKWLVLVNAGLFLFLLLLRAFSFSAYVTFLAAFGLVPELVTSGYLWQVGTYAFLHAGVFHVLINMLILWMFGSAIEDLLRRRQFLEFYLFCVVGAALVTIVFSYTRLLGMAPTSMTVGASGGVFGVMMAFAMIYGERQIFMFPFPFMIKAKYMIAVLIFIQIAGALSQSGNVAYLAHLGGLLFGYIYVKTMPVGGLSRRVSGWYERYREAYYRRKRRRAARKFEVYMRKHNRSVYFDEHGNYIGPEPPADPENRGEPPWVN